jgi:hypothetical protein
MAVATTILAGTTAGVLLQAHPLAAGLLITMTWAAGTWRGFHYLRDAERALGGSGVRGSAPDAHEGQSLGR